MKKVLIINLKRNGDIIALSPLIKSLKRKDPLTQIFLLTYKQFLNAAKCLENIEQIFTIDRDLILTYKNNKLFSEGFAVNTFFSDLAPVKAIKWTEVVNSSNDKTSSFITSYLSCDKFYGNRISKQGTLESSNSWSVVYNELLSSFTVSPVHLVDVQTHLVESEQSYENNQLKSLSKNDELARENLDKLRNYSKDKVNPKLIGVQLVSSLKSKDIPTESLINLLKYLQDSKYFIPLLLISTSTQEIEMANKINQNFEKKLVTIESDIVALSSVTKYLDLIVTPDTMIKHIADCSSTPVIEVSRGHKLFRKHGPYTKRSLVLCSIEDFNPFKNQTDDNFNVRGEDLIQSIEYFFGLRSISNVELQKDFGLFKVDHDELGVRYLPILGNMNVRDELIYINSRNYLNALLNQHKIEVSDFAIIKNLFSKKEVVSFISQEKELLTTTLRNILNTIRALHNLKEAQDKNIENFYQKVQIMISECRNNQLSAIPVKLFRTFLESFSLDRLPTEISKIEKRLFGLKNELQTLNIYLNDLQRFIESRETYSSTRSDNRQVLS